MNIFILSLFESIYFMFMENIWCCKVLSPEIQKMVENLLEKQSCFASALMLSKINEIRFYIKIETTC